MADTLTADGELTWASFPIEKVEQTEDGNVLVWGKATDASIDSDQQIIDADFAAKAMDEFFGTGPNIRVQHQAQRDPAGVGVSFEREGDAHWLKSKIIEPVAKQLVLGGALRAYSVGIARPTIVRDVQARGGRITDGQFVEISLVDRPANKNCGIQLVKAAANGHAEWIGKVFGSNDMIAKALGDTSEPSDVTITFPSDVQMSFSPLDMAKIVARKQQNGSVEKWPTRYEGGVPVRAAEDSTDDEDGDEDAVAKAPIRYEGGPPTPSHSMAEGCDDDDDDDDAEKASDAPLTAVGKAEDAALNMALALGGDYVREFLGKGARTFTASQRREHARAGNALPDGSYPIPDADALRRAAILARSKHGKWQAAMRLIARRARELKVPNPLKGKTAKKAAIAVAVQAIPGTEKKHKVVCMKCGAKQNMQHRFCTECGVAMETPDVAKNHDFVCLGCGHELDKGERFCPECGKKNPGHNPMADQKIPANKMLRMAAGRDRVANEPDTGLMAEKAKKPRKGKGKGRGPSAGFSGLPRHLPGAEEHVFDRDAAAKSADLAIATSMRLKNLGIDQEMGYAHDLVCPAFSWDDVAKSYPAGLDNLNADAWQQKALDAASSAPLAQAQAASRLGQAVFTIKSASLSALRDVKSDINKAFRDANPGPGSAPTPGSVTAQSFKRPKITTGHAAYSHQYDEGAIQASVPEGQTTASHFGRPYMQDGRAEDSPANKAGRNMPVPSENGKPMNLDYSNVHKEQILQAYSAMHDHFDRVFPGVCPMNAPASGPSPHPLAQKARKGSDKGFRALTEAVIALPDTIKGEVVNALAGQPADAAKPALDRRTIEAVLRKSQKTSDKKFNALTEAVSILADQSAQAAAQPVPGEPARPGLSRKAVAEVLRKAQKTSDKRFLALTEAVSALPGTIKNEVASALPSGEPARPALDAQAVAAVLRKAQKTSDKRFMALTEAVNALPGAIKGEVANGMPVSQLAVSADAAGASQGSAAKPGLSRKAVEAVLRKARKTSDKKIMALTEAVSALADQPPAGEPAAPGLDRKTVAAVLRKAQKASDRKFLALAEDRKAVEAVLRKAQKTSDKRFQALTEAVNARASQPPQAAQNGSVNPGLDSEAIAAVLRKAQKVSDRKFLALTQAVNALPGAIKGDSVKPGLDNEAIAAVLRKAQRTSDRKIAALTKAVSAIADQPSQAYRGMPVGQLAATPQRAKPSRPAGARFAALRKAQKDHDKKLLALTQAMNVLADQPDPATQAFKGMAINPLRTKAAGPAGPQSVAEIAERTQAMMLHELEAQWRNSTDPAQREAAWNASLKMRGLLNDS